VDSLHISSGIFSASLPDEILKNKFSNLDGGEIVVFKFIPSALLFSILRHKHKKGHKTERRRVDYIMPQNLVRIKEQNSI
jgi:hypothetical protein